MLNQISIVLSNNDSLNDILKIFNRYNKLNIFWVIKQNIFSNSCFDYPSSNWLRYFAEYVYFDNLTLWICGTQARRIAEGKTEFFHDSLGEINRYKEIQLTFPYKIKNTFINEKLIKEIKNLNKKIVIDIDSQFSKNLYAQLLQSGVCCYQLKKMNCLNINGYYNLNIIYYKACRTIFKLNIQNEHSSYNILLDQAIKSNNKTDLKKLNFILATISQKIKI